MPEKIHLYVVFDANILISDFWMVGKELRYLRKYKFFNHRPVIPRVAFIEARNHMQDRAEELLRNVRDDGERSEGNRKRLLRLFNYRRVPRNPQWSIDNLLKRWESYIKDILNVNNGIILPLPNVSLRELSRRSLNRQKPFSKKDRGFKDTLIWLSTLDLVDANARVSFVTQNINDFFDKSKSQPHPEIEREANQRTKGNWKMLFHDSVADFIENMDSDKSISAETLHHALISESLPNFSLWKWLEENLLNVIGDYEFDGIEWAGVPYYAEAPVLTVVEELISIDIPGELQSINEGIYRLCCDVGFIGHLRCEILLSEAEKIISPKQTLWKDSRDKLWTYTEIRAVCTFAASLDFDFERNCVVSAVAIPLVHWNSYDEVLEELEEERDSRNFEV